MSLKGFFIFFILVSKTVYCQQVTFLLDKQFLFPSERLSYTYINHLQEGDNLLFVALLDLQTKELVDFVYHTTEDKIIEGSIVLGRDLSPGYYAALAFKAGYPELHYEQFWVWDATWQRLGGSVSLSSGESGEASLNGKFRNPEVRGSVEIALDTALLWQGPLIVDADGHFELKLDSSILDLISKEPIWVFIEVSDEKSQAAYHRFPLHWPEEALKDREGQEEVEESTWMSASEDELWLHPSVPGSLRIVVMGRAFFEREGHTPADTLKFARAQLPTGRLDILFQPEGATEYYWEELWNHPIVEQKQKRISLRSGEEFTLDLPAMQHPWVSKSTHFISARLEDGARRMSQSYRGRVLLPDTLDRTLDVIIMSSEGRKNPPKNRTVLFTNGEYILDLKTDKEGEFRISRQELSMFGNNEGRIRFREEHSRVRLSPEYPGITWVKQHVAEIARQMQLQILERASEIDLPEAMPEMDFGDEWVIDLEEVVVGGKSIEERIQEVLEDRFALDWLNEDWINEYGMMFDLYPGTMGPYIGNTPGSPVKLPLHLVYTPEIQRKIRYPPFQWNGTEWRRPRIRRFLRERNPRPYTWSPDDYLDQVGSLKLPIENNLNHIEKELNLQLGEKKWVNAYLVNKINFISPLKPGTYLFQLNYWDLYHNLRTTVNYEVLVRN
jgi:hypothetical protein